MTKRRVIMGVLLFLSVIGIIYLGIILFQGRRYNLISMIVVFLAGIPFYAAYEKKEGDLRRMVIVAVLVAIAVVGRTIFAPIPFFKPVTAVVILAAVYMGPETGFLVGSLSAILSNIFFGQGPWTAFQMLSWGMIGFIAGLPGLRRVLRTKAGMVVYGMVSGLIFSAVMDIWAVLAADGTFNWKRYLVLLGTAVPVTIAYMASNIVFLLIGSKAIGRKLERISIKHGIFELE